jgi:SAM-dependent methyltransferase
MRSLDRVNNIRPTCPEHGKELVLSSDGSNFFCSEGCRYKILNKIPRFIPDDNYASSFGLQWNKFRKTQLDSYTGLSITRDRLTRIAGGSLGIFGNKNVLEAGCGAGRFTEIMLQAGARVFAVDISNAVEANYENCKDYRNYFVCQADIKNLPFLAEQFDIVVCIGVIQHTPDPEETMSALCLYVKPGGLLLIDHYTHGYPITPSRRILRQYLLKKSKRFSMIFCQVLTAIFWPFHRLFWIMRKIRWINKLRDKFLYYSPVVDYHDTYPSLKGKLQFKWALLDTHDTLTDYYKHLRSAEEIKSHLLKYGMTDIVINLGGNGIEARACKLINR